MSNKQIKVTLIKSLAKKLAMHQNNVRGLGLRRMHQSVTLQATPEVMGMVRESAHMLKVEEVR
jgi:large subunit ribosomal protein L30